MKFISKKTCSFITLTFCFFHLFAFDRPVVSDISATYYRGTKIGIVWTIPSNLQSPITSFKLYRDTKPLSAPEDILKAQLIATLTPMECGYTDNVNDYRDYFYAIIICCPNPYNVIIPSMNATIHGAHLIPSAPKENESTANNTKTYENGKLRETPLPYLDLLDKTEENEKLISDEATTRAKKLGLEPEKKHEEIAPYFFEEDLIEPDNGDAYFLFEILAKSFVIKDYDKALTDLKKLAGTKISEDVVERTYFYIGETYFFLGNYEEAIKYFIKTQLTFPILSKKWISESLDRL